MGSLTGRRGQRRVTVGPEATGTGQTALDLIKDQDSTNLVTALAESNKELGRGDVDTTLALDRLDNHTTSVLGDEGLKLLHIVVCAVLETGDHGREGSLVLGVRGRRQGTHCTTVEGVVEGDKLVLRTGGIDRTADLTGELDCCFVGFGAGVGDEDLGSIAHATRFTGQVDQKLTQSTSPRVVVEVGGVKEGLGL